MIPVQKHMRAQAGFTLVELAIVMIIIGLLIAGVLKGQALIQNAQVTSTVAQTKAIEAATTTFRDTYAALPGDIASASTKLPNCLAVPCSVPAAATLGDGRITNAPGAAPSNEAEAYFVQLNAASLLTGIVPSAANLTTFGGNFPEAKITSNGFGVGSTSIPPVAGDFAGVIGAAATLPAPGVYLVLTGTLAGAQTATTGGLTASQALRIDTKLDDGVPDTGEVQGFGTPGALNGDCGTASAAGVAGVYATVGNSAVCGLYIHSQS
jgi:prepilin-type N-terminal cleavage/methylation domain-containing protein